MYTEVLLLLLVSCVISLEASLYQRPIEQLLIRSNQFGNKLYNVVAEANTNKNVIVSPFSIYLALLMLEFGACGGTQKILKDCLYLPDDHNITVEATKELKENFKMLQIANNIFINKNFKLKPKYAKLILNTFKTSPSVIDVDKPEEAAQQINKYVEDNTNSAIQNFIQSSEINYQTVLILVNAIHFKAEWKDEFPKESMQSFYKKNNCSIEVPTMKIKKSFAHGVLQYLNATFIKIPYKNWGIEMVIIKPDQIEGLNEMEHKLESFDIEITDKHYSTNEIELHLPKFNFERSFQLNTLLDKINLSDLFGQPNLNAIAEAQLTVSQIKHNAVIEVNPKGTEASAVTSVQTIYYSALMPELKLDTFIVDRPFHFIIRIFGTTIFQGHVYDPS